MAANNMVNPSVDPSREDEIFAREVAQVKQWWSDPRWRYTKRPFTAEQIVSKRGNLKIEYPSDAQSRKLWDILEGRFKVCFFLYSPFHSSLPELFIVVVSRQKLNSSAEQGC